MVNQLCQLSVSCVTFSKKPHFDVKLMEYITKNLYKVKIDFQNHLVREELVQTNQGKLAQGLKEVMRKMQLSSARQIMVYSLFKQIRKLCHLVAK